MNHYNVWKHHPNESSGEPLSPSSETWRYVLKLYPNSPWALSDCDFIDTVTIYCLYFLWMPFYSETILYLLPTRIFLHLLWQVWALLGQAFLDLCAMGLFGPHHHKHSCKGQQEEAFSIYTKPCRPASRTKQQWLFYCGCSEIQRIAFPRRHSATPFWLYTKEGRLKFGRNNPTKLRKQIFTMYVFYRVICRHLKAKNYLDTVNVLQSVFSQGPN